MLMSMFHRGHSAAHLGWGWFIVAGFILLVLVVTGFVYLRLRQSDGLSRSERRQLGPMEAEILAMLRQTGRPLGQSEIGQSMGMDVDDIAEAMHFLEGGGLVRREWSSDRQTYLVWPR